MPGRVHLPRELLSWRVLELEPPAQEHLERREQELPKRALLMQQGLEREQGLQN